MISKMESCQLVLRSWQFVAITILAIGFSPNTFLFGRIQEGESVEHQGSLNGIVRDEEGEIVAGAKVFLCFSEDESVSISRDPKPIHILTDELGKYEVTDLKPGYYRAWAEAKGQISTRQILNGEKFVVPKGKDFSRQIDFRLGDGCNYAVAIIDAKTKKPISDAVVSFGYADAPRSFVTDEFGVADIRGLPICSWYFVVKAKGYAVAHKPTSAQKVGTTTRIDFELDRDTGIFGELIDQRGRPIADAKIHVSSDAMLVAPAYAKIVTDAQGMFRTNGLPAHEKLRIGISKPEFKFQTFYVELEKVGEPEKVFLEGEELPYGGDVIITVVNSKGEPVEGIELINRGNGTGVTRNATTDEDGIGRLKNLLRYQGCHVVARGKGMIPKSVRVEPGTQDKPAELRVQLEPGKTIHGRVVSPEGEPIERSMVLVYSGVDFVTLEDLKWKRIYSDAEGRFEIDGLEEPTKLRIMPRYRSDFVEVKGFQVDFDKEEQLVELPYGAELRIRAVDSMTGEPIPEFNVKLGLVDFRQRQPNDIVSGVEVSLTNPGVNIQGATKEFVLKSEPDGAVFKVIVSAEGYQTKTLNRVEARVKPDLLDVELRKQ